MGEDRALYLEIAVWLHSSAGRGRIFHLASLVRHSIVIQELRTSRQELVETAQVMKRRQIRRQSTVADIAVAVAGDTN